MKNLSSFCLRPALGLALGGLLLASCESKSDQVAPLPTPSPTGTGTSTNVYITNEGAFRQSTASVSLFDKTTKTVTAGP